MKLQYSFIFFSYLLTFSNTYTDTNQHNAVAISYTVYCRQQNETNITKLTKGLIRNLRAQTTNSTLGTCQQLVRAYLEGLRQNPTQLSTQALQPCSINSEDTESIPALHYPPRMSSRDTQAITIRLLLYCKDADNSRWQELKGSLLKSKIGTLDKILNTYIYATQLSEQEHIISSLSIDPENIIAES